MTLTERENIILRIVVADYIVGVKPMASKDVANRCGLNLSPATIRNDMVNLEQEGYIMRPHASAGSIPTDKGYRYYVQSIRQDVELPASEQYVISQLFQEAKEEMDEWLRVAAVLLSRMVHNIAVVTFPNATHHHFKRLDLVLIQDFLALLIIVLYEAKIMQRFLYLDRAFTQDALTKLANKFNDLYPGMGSDQILASKEDFPHEEKQIAGCLAEMIATEDKKAYGKPYLEGLRLLLSQPEFCGSKKLSGIFGVLESEDWLEEIPYQAPSHGRVRIIIGGENSEVELQDLSLLIGQYGIPDKVGGLLGVVGPRRMDYARNISSLNYLSTLLSNKVIQYV